MSIGIFAIVFKKLHKGLIHILPDAKVSLELTPLRPNKGRVKDRHK